jgi:hypothetical protein
MAARKASAAASSRSTRLHEGAGAVTRPRARAPRAAARKQAEVAPLCVIFYIGTRRGWRSNGSPELRRHPRPHAPDENVGHEVFAPLGQRQVLHLIG